MVCITSHAPRAFFKSRRHGIYAVDISGTEISVRALSCEPNSQLNFCTTSKTEVEVVLKSPSDSLLTVPKWSFCCGSMLPVFGVRVSVTFHQHVFILFFSSVSVAEWPPFGK